MENIIVLMYDEKQGTTRNGNNRVKKIEKQVCAGSFAFHSQGQFNYRLERLAVWSNHPWPQFAIITS